MSGLKNRNKLNDMERDRLIKIMNDKLEVRQYHDVKAGVLNLTIFGVDEAADAILSEEKLKERIYQIIANQNNPMLHPLTCGNDSKHTPLIPTIVKDEIVLICADCDYTQKY